MDTRRKNKLILLSVAFILFIQALLIYITKFGQIPSVSLNPQVTCQVIRNHHQKQYKMNDLPLGRLGDTFVYHVPLPKAGNKKALCFHQKHAIVTAYVGQRKLKNIAPPSSGKVIGDQLFIIPLSANERGKTLTIYAHHVEKDYSSHFTYFRLMNITQAQLYPLIGNGLVTLIFIFTLMFSIFLMGSSFVGVMISMREMLSSFLLGFIVFCASLWQLAETRVLYIFVQNRAFCAQAEYYTFYIGVCVLFIYFASLQNKRKMMISFMSMAGVFALFMLGLHLYAASSGHVLIDYELSIYIVIGILFLIAIVMTLIAHRHKPKKYLYANVLMLSTILLILHVLLSMSDAVLLGHIHYTNISGVNLSSISLIIFFTAVISASNDKFFRLVMDKAKKQQLEHFAFIDALTGIPNRQFCDRLMKDLTQDYAIVFLDVDYLKKANDQYGHAVGDALLKIMAHIISESVDQTQGFCGRWGGDEFIMGFYHEKDVPLALAKMNDMIDNDNQKQLFPFTLFLSYGIAKGKEGLTPEQVRAQADANMYLFKQQHHRAR